jgi:beta-lactamase regulating signal transducer with metallopeptidase domain
MGEAATAPGWLLHTMAGGGLLLLLAWLAMRCVGGPARRQRLGEWAVVAAVVLSVLSLGPAWLQVPLPAFPSLALRACVPEAPACAETPSPAPAAPEEPAAVERVPPSVPLVEPPLGISLEVVLVPTLPAPETLEAPAEPPAAVEPPEEKAVLPADPPAPLPPPFWTPERVVGVALGIYGLGALVLLGRWLLGHVGLWRLLRRAGPAPARAAEIFADMSAGRGRPRLLVSRQVRVPFSCGLWRPAVVLPAALAEEAPEPILRWVFAHELTHLERRDARAALLFGLGGVLYFYLPWFWWLRRQVRLCQEFLADAAAARLGQPVEYAEFLVGWTTAPAPPVGATGVSGPCSDLFRRIAMLLHNPTPLESRCPRRWSALAAASLLGLAVVGAGLGLSVRAAPAPPPREEPKKEAPGKEEPKKEEPKKEENKKEEGDFDFGFPVLPDLQEMLKHLLPGFSREQVEQMHKQMAQQRKEMEKAFQRMRGLRGLQRMPQDFGGMPGFGLPGGQGPEPRLGVRVDRPSATLVDQLDLPRGQGTVIEEVAPNSPADKAGLKAHDILLELNGKPVPSKPEEVARLVAGIKAGTPVDAVVLRKGKRETIKGLSLPEAREAKEEAKHDPFGGFNPLGGNFPAPVFPAFPDGGPFANLGGGGAFAAAGGNGVMTTTFRSGDRFTTRHQEGSLVINVTGKVADGKSTVGEIRVQDGRESHKYESVDKVPEAYRDKVKNLIEMTGKSNIRIEIQK